MTLKLWEKLRSGIVDTHPRLLQQLRHIHVPSFAFQNDNWGRVSNTGRYQIPVGAPANNNDRERVGVAFRVTQQNEQNRNEQAP